MSSLRLLPQMALACAFALCVSSSADAQIVRRFAGGGVQIRAPFVRVNVGPGGETYVRAPFTSVATPGRPFLGRRRRLLGQQPNGAGQRRVAPRTLNTSAQPGPQPEIADVDALPYPTAEDMSLMGDSELVETLRKMMARLHYRLSLLKTGEGWQKYLVLSREILGSPGTGAEILHPGAVPKVLPRYRSTQDNPEFVKIATLPSFIAAFDALREVNRRFPATATELPITRSEVADPTPEIPAKVKSPVDESSEILPTPTPAGKLPNASRGERSILKRK